MAVSIWAKRVADPLEDKVKARFLGEDCRLMAGCASSGSEHEATDPSCFSGLVHAFLEEDGPRSAAAADDAEKNYKSESDSSDRSVDSAAMVRGLLEMSRKKDPFRLRLLSDVSELAEALVGLPSRGSGYRQAVMGQLRESGYNAGLCKARWDTCGGLAAGSYEYIDVIVTNEGSERRYIVDLDFSEQFEVARATEECAAVVGTLPRVMVGTAEEVRQLVRIMSDATRRSLRSRDMHVPPWRKTKYMLAKWFGPYRRTTIAIPSYGGDTAPAGLCDVKCRAVGFHATQRLVIPPATRKEKKEGEEIGLFFLSFPSLN